MSRVVAILASALALAPALHAQNFLGKSLNQWRQELKASDDAQRRNAAFALGQMGGDAVAALGELKAVLLNDKNPKVKEAAAFAIGDLAKLHLRAAKDFGLVPALDKALNDPDPRVRRSAAYAAGCLGSDAAALTGRLDLLLGDSSSEVRQNVAWSLGRIGVKTVPSLKRALTDSDPTVKRDAASSLSLLPDDAIRDALPSLLLACRENNSEVRRAALVAIVKVIGPEDAKGASFLLPALKDPDSEIKCNAALALSNIGGKEARPGLLVLVEALRKGDIRLKRQAAAAIRNIGEDAAEAVPDLQHALGSTDPGLRANAAMALGGIGPRAAGAFEALVRIIENPSEQTDTRVEAAVALSRIGDVPAAEAAVPRLLRVLGDRRNDVRVRERIVWALRVHNARLRNLDVFPTFTQVLQEKGTGVDNRMLRYDCAYLMGMLQGPAVEPITLDTLDEFLKDKDIQIFVGKKASVQGAGNETGGGKVDVREVGKGDGRIMVIQALEKIGPQRVIAYRQFTPQLQRLANDANTDPDLKAACKDLLRELR